MSNTSQLIGLSTGAIIGGVVGFEIFKKNEIVGLIAGASILGVAGFFMGKALAISTTTGSNVAIDQNDIAGLAAFGTGQGNNGNFNIETPAQKAIFGNINDNPAYNPNITDAQAAAQTENTLNS